MRALFVIKLSSAHNLRRIPFSISHSTSLPQEFLRPQEAKAQHTPEKLSTYQQIHDDFFYGQPSSSYQNQRSKLHICVAGSGRVVCSGLLAAMPSAGAPEHSAHGGLREVEGS